MFSDQDKLIFPYQDGSRDDNGALRWVHGDPLEFSMRISRAAAEDNFKDILDQMANAPSPFLDKEGTVRNPDYDPVNHPALIAMNTERAIPIIQKIFNIIPLDKVTGLGLTWDQTMAVMRAFNRFQADLKKNGGGSPNTLQPGDGIPMDTAAPINLREARPTLPTDPPDPPEPAADMDVGKAALLAAGRAAILAQKRPAVPVSAAGFGGPAPVLPPSIMQPIAASNGISPGFKQSQPLPWPVPRPQPPENRTGPM
jgi:hypothetical protein